MIQVKVEPLSKLAFVAAPAGWSVALSPAPYSAPAPTGIVLDFALPANSGFVAALIAGSSPAGTGSTLDFSLPTNSGLLAALAA